MASGRARQTIAAPVVFWAGTMTDPARFIRRHLPLTPAPGIAGLRLHLARPGSGLRRLCGDQTPYWAYVWAGGAALVHHLRANPALVCGRRVLDLGAGSGLVGIAAAQAGAAQVLALDPDPFARIAIGLNATANAVTLQVLAADPPKVDILLAGDVFYDGASVAPLLATLRRASATGALVLVGDPGRSTLPLDQLVALATYLVADMGGTAVRPAVVDGLRPAQGAA